IEHYLEYTSATFSFKDYYKTIFADTGFLPFFLQIYCSILYERLSMKTSFTIESISEEFLEESKAHFSFIWTTLPEQEKNLIIKIILQKQISIKDEYVVKNLILKGYIFKTDDSYILFSLSFRTFLINEKAFIEDKRKFLKGTGNKNLGVFGLINKRKLKLFSIALAFVCIVLLGIVLKKRFDVPTPSNTIENKIVVSRGVTLIYDKASKNYIKVGKFYALLIGIEKYEDSFYPTLTEPLNDVTELKSVLISKYTFDSTNVRVLQNPSKNEIFRALIFYRDSLTPDDNLFVFYAGHGCYDKKADMGYLIPSDADNKNDATWVSYQDIRSKFNVIEAKHILLIADACFAGSVFRSVDSIRPEHVDAMTRERISTRSRTAFTSADLKPVPDKSEFLKYLTSALENNLSPLLLSEDLYINTRNTLKVGTSKKDPVKWGALQDCNDMGGDFVFVRRSDSANLSN
ncbi:MAG: caspase family protein, partial [Bacteroidales bacterium]